MSFYEMNNGIGELHGATISGNTSESTLFKQTVSLFKNDELIQTASIQTNGIFTFQDIEQSGNYKIKAISTDNIPTEIDVNVTAENIIEKDVISVKLPLNYVTIIGTTDEQSLFSKTVNLYQNDKLIDTAAISSNGSFTFLIIKEGNYTLKATNGTDEATEDLSISKLDLENKISIRIDLSFLKIVTFQNGTDEEIAAMINAHYAGKINIADYWSTEDRRLIHLNAMSATGVSESHHADDYYIVIAGINHDNLTSGGKAAITLCLERILFKDTTTESYSFSWSPTEECGYMNSSNTNAGGWENCARRTWCNKIFFNALPSWAQSLIKPVDKLTSAGNQSTTIKTTSDKVFLFSEVEILGANTYSAPGEGEQYDLFKITTNRYKKPAYSGYNSSGWWERSPHVSGSTYFCYVYIDGSASNNVASYCYGLVPAFCF